MKLKPEERAEVAISIWLNEYQIPVYFNRSSIASIAGAKTFSVKGIVKKPDLLFFHEKWYVVEVKSGLGSKNTRDAKKIVDYYNNVVDHKTQYFVDGKIVFPTGFLVATLFSKEGHLFVKERERHSIPKLTSTIQGRPQKEYDQTFFFVRNLWDEWGKQKKKEYSMGVLLSNKLNYDKNQPAIFEQRYNHKTKSWRPPHSFYTIGRRYEF